VLDVELMGMLLRLVRMMISMWQCNISEAMASNGNVEKTGWRRMMYCMPFQAKSLA
jgi:hypothetical protein